MIELHCGDCLDVMAKLPEQSVDMVLCDLPYGCFKRGWDTVIPFDKLWQQYERLVRPKGAIILFATNPFSSALVMSNPKMFRCEWIWNKVATSGFLNANRHPLQSIESILVFGKQAVNYYPQMVKRDKPRKTGGAQKSRTYGLAQNNGRMSTHMFPRNLLTFKCVSKSNRLHPTQKPIDLLQYLIKTYSLEGQTVLDNTMGSGSTGVAAVGCGRNFIGIEKEPTFFKIAEERIHCDILSNYA